MMEMILYNFTMKKIRLGPKKGVFMKKLINVLLLSCMMSPLLGQINLQEMQNSKESGLIEQGQQMLNKGLSDLKYLGNKVFISGSKIVDTGCKKLHEKVEQQKFVNTPKRRLVNRQTSLRFVDDMIELAEQGFDSAIKAASSVKASVIEFFNTSK